MDHKVGEAMKTTREKVKKTYTAVAAVEKSTETGNTNASKKVNKGTTNHNIRQCLRIQVVPADPIEGKRENFVSTNAKVNDIPDAMESERSLSSSKDLESLTPNGRNYERFF